MSGYPNKIAIVEDVIITRKMLKKKLEKLGFSNLYVANDAAEAWQEITHATLSDYPFELIITDLNMPQLDGMDLLRQIKQDPMSENIKVIIVSADADPIVIKEAMDLGAEEYFTKPVDFELLAAAMAKIL